MKHYKVRGGVETASIEESYDIRTKEEVRTRAVSTGAGDESMGRGVKTRAWVGEVRTRAWAGNLKK